jgi:type II secretory pathway pseudopilin PulG
MDAGLPSLNRVRTMNARTRRNAFTLFETIIVLAVLVISTAVAIPSLRAMQGSYRLNGAVDSFRSSWAQARARAIEESRPYRVSIEPDGSHFRIAPDLEDYWTGTPPQDDPAGRGYIKEDCLPGGVRFALNNAPSLASDDATPGAAPAPDAYSTAVVFLPDGTAREDVRVVFNVRGCKPKTLELRGLTGASTVRSGE